MSIGAICVSRRPTYVDRALANDRRQTCANTRLTFVANSDAFDWDAVESALAVIPGASLLRLSDRLTLGKCLNKAIRVTDGDFFAKQLLTSLIDDTVPMLQAHYFLPIDMRGRRVGPDRYATHMWGTTRKRWT